MAITKFNLEEREIEEEKKKKRQLHEKRALCSFKYRGENWCSLSDDGSSAVQRGQSYSTH